MTLPEPTATAMAKPQRGWRRGLLMAALVLVVSLVLRNREQTEPRGAHTAPSMPAVTPSALPADVSLNTLSPARPRLLILLPPSPDQPTAGLALRLRQACAERLAIVEGDARVAGALGLESLPAFVLYDAAGQEAKRLNGPDAIGLLMAELQAMGLASAGAAAETTP